MMDYKHRKRNRLYGYDYSRQGAYFITICTLLKQPLLSRIVVGDAAHGVPNAAHGVPRISLSQDHIIETNPSVVLTQAGEMVAHYIQNINTIYSNVVVDRCVIMPDHVHLILLLNVCKPDNADQTGTQVMMEGTPVQIQGTPVQMEGTPVQMEGTPVQMEGTPVQMEGTPVQMEGTPWAASPTDVSVPKIMNSFKTLTSKKYGRPIWQRSYYDRIIRDDDEYQSIIKYIEENPKRWVQKHFPILSAESCSNPDDQT